MDILFDTTLAPRLIFTLVAVAIAIGPMFADFNATHATNPLWPPHARFHVVWQVLSQAGVSMAILFLLWRDTADYGTHIWLAACLNYVWGASFFTTLASMSRFDGALKDVNGIKPWRWNIFGKVYMVDTNLGGGSILMLINTAGVILLCQ